ncbi:right-handed parallel beta-helix repeat-containing protein [Gallalistipes aquisgranensis]|uniref:right-handed parallel beta-helix repeat-containing protein n=1 Tax=Gallalistipes aquisgranensis TaxID=2779358 RepID=UPI001CF7FACE|nr:right-handed parallel beta-helix repeat-containing protein [Gallalistipes aquisgranensis]MBE5034415.1 right-handed parallel beta-helix repeat-containing protein [Gallalistipes aquisgranensis]
MKLIFKNIFLALGLLLCAGTGFAKPAGMELRNTFSSCSVYIGADTESQCDLRFRQKGTGEWKEAYPPVYDTIWKEFRGSIVLLDEDTPYEVKATLTRDGKTIGEYTGEFRTWTSNPTVAKTVKLSSLFGKKKNRGIAVDGLKGTADGWIRIVGDEELDAGNKTDYAIRFTNCEYVILEGATIKGGLKCGIDITETVSDLRIINCDISHWGRVPVSQNKDGQYLDREGNRINNDGGIRLERGRNVVVERCYIHDPNGLTNPWHGTIHLGPLTGQKYRQRHPVGPCGIFVVENGGNFVVRYNDIVGSQAHRYNDAIEGWKNGFVEGGFKEDADVYGNMLGYGQDDGIELDGGQCNVRLYNNRFEQTYCGMSLAPNKKGPSYIFGNVVWNLGSSTGSASAAVKNGGGFEHTLGRQFLFNNTMYVFGNGMRGVGYGRKPNDSRERFIATTRNNMFISVRKPEGSGKDSKGQSITDHYEIPENDFDYDMVGNTRTPDKKGFMKARPGSETHGVFACPEFTSAFHGVFTLKANDPGIDKGTVIPNFRETFNGKAPDMGALEYGASSLIPIRPIDIESDYYYVRLEEGKTKTVKIAVGDIGKETGFTIRKAEDMEWLTVTPSATTLKPNSTLTLKISVKPSEERLVGMFFVRLDNGFSVPISTELKK